MVSVSEEKHANEIQEDFDVRATAHHENNDQISLQIISHQSDLVDKKHKDSYSNTVEKLSSNTKQKKFDPSPSAKFRRIAKERDEFSQTVPSLEQRSIRYLMKKIDWVSLRELCKQWARNPMNMALLVWVLCVTVSGAILFLVMTGMLNNAIPKKSQRDTWFEVNNQILNALFTLMCLYQHPKRFYHLVLLCRWRNDDILKLRKVYCKNGTYKPNEWVHMMVVIVLLHLNCFAQYALCGLNLGYTRSKRPPIGVGICISVAIGAPAFASVYNILSPLGKEYETEVDQEAQGEATDIRTKSLEKKYSFVARDDQRVADTAPKWIGGIFDIWDDISVAYLSFFCTCCVFGWNMQRLGFGNMYVHIATFLLFCIAPFFIFNLAAVNINNEGVREALGITGFFLCIFGLLYGGFWRIQLRKRFNLPGYTFCGNSSVSDCFLWLFCCGCSLAQEVRTADYYDLVDNKLCLKVSDGDQSIPSPARSTNSSYLDKSSTLSGSTPKKSQGGYSSPQANLTTVIEEESSIESVDGSVKAPFPMEIQREDDSKPS